MTRQEALEMVAANVKNKNLIKHMLAAEAVMKALAARLGGDVGRWGLAGLLHDIDYDVTAKDPAQHSKLGAEMLKSAGVDDDIVHAVLVHNEFHGLPRTSLMDKALFAVDPLTGLIVAAALIHRDKRLSAIDSGFVLNRFGEKSFAKGANREQIQSCSELGLGLEEFVEIALRAMQGISDELGL